MRLLTLLLLLGMSQYGLAENWDETVKILKDWATMGSEAAVDEIELKVCSRQIGISEDGKQATYSYEIIRFMDDRYSKVIFTVVKEEDFQIKSVVKEETLVGANFGDLSKCGEGYQEYKPQMRVIIQL